MLKFCDMVLNGFTSKHKTKPMTIIFENRLLESYYVTPEIVKKGQ
jgi:hypothetical protein